MSLALIQDAAKEIRRLAVAGSALAVGDFRLKKLIEPLEQAGAKVPVFAQVAKAMNQLAHGTEAESAANLLNLSTLLNAILYTQGQTGAEGSYREIEGFPASGWTTRTSARTLRPIVQALTQTGSGRLEIVKSALERGAVHDLRLIDPAIYALGDIYPELAELVANQILPGFGEGIVPRLKNGLDLKGKKADARRLELLHRFDPAGTLALCQSALDEGSPEVKATAVRCLGQHAEGLAMVFEQANAKNKIVRAAALEALAQHDRPDVAKLFTELIQGKSLEILVGPFRDLRSQSALRAMIEEGKRVFGLLAKGDSEQIPRFVDILDCLNARKESAVEDFVLACFDQSEKLGKLKAAKNFHVAGEDVVHRLANLLFNVGTAKTRAAILEKRDRLPVNAFGFVLHSALKAWPAEKVFDEFSPLLNQTRGPGKAKLADLANFISLAHDQNSDLGQITWDPRWLEAAIKANHHALVCTLARPNHPGVLAYLLNPAKANKTPEIGLTIAALAQCHYPQVTDYFLALLEKKTHGAKQLDYELQYFMNHVRLLPAADLPKLDAFAGKLDEKFVDHFLECLGPLRAAGPTV